MLSHSLAYQMATSLTVAAFLAGCSGPDPQAGPAPSTQADASIEAFPGPLDSPPGDIASRTDLLHEDLVRWEIYDVRKQTTSNNDDEPSDPNLQQVPMNGYEVVGDKQIRVFFSSGSARCMGFRTLVEEDPAKIAIAIIEGHLPDPKLDGECAAAITFSHSMLIDLKEPVGDRAIVPLARPESLNP